MHYGFFYGQEPFLLDIKRKVAKKLDVGLIHDEYSECFIKVLSIWMKMLQKPVINVTSWNTSNSVSYKAAMSLACHHVIYIRQIRRNIILCDDPFIKIYMKCAGTTTASCPTSPVPTHSSRPRARSSSENPGPTQVLLKKTL